MVTSTLFHLAQAESRQFHPNHLFIKMNAGEALAQSKLIKSSKNIIGDIYLVKTSNVKALEAELSQSAEIEYVQKDFFGARENSAKHEVLDPIKMNISSANIANFDSFNDPDVSKLWGFNDVVGMNVTSAYASLPPMTPEEVIVAVVDTGVDHTHEDLVDSMWTNDGEIPADRIDNDGNGYIDDIHGINTLVRDNRGNATMNTMPSMEPDGGYYHGTHVAGSIAATQNNGIGLAGVASNAKIMAIRTVPDASDELDSDIVEAFKYAANMGAKVINCSFGKKVNEGGMVVRDVMEEVAKSHGVMVVAAAGNESKNIDSVLSYPASFETDSMLVVAATTSSGGLAYFSNTGLASVDVAAPGSNIYSTLPGNTYGPLSGTSMASPNTAGVAAMVRGYFPHLSPQQVRQVLMDSVTKVANFKTKMAAGGRVNLQSALQKAAEIK